MNKIILILITLLLLMLILKHVEDKRMEDIFGTYGDGKYVDPSTFLPLPPPTSNGRDYPGDEPSTAPPPGTPIWCPPPEEGYGPPPPYPGADKCIY